MSVSNILKVLGLENASETQINQTVDLLQNLKQKNQLDLLYILTLRVYNLFAAEIFEKFGYVICKIQNFNFTINIPNTLSMVVINLRDFAICKYTCAFHPLADAFFVSDKQPLDLKCYLDQIQKLRDTQPPERRLGAFRVTKKQKKKKKREKS